MKKTKIGIIGSGPCGISCALQILKENEDDFEITIIEKGERGKDKICGDAFSKLDFKLLSTIGILEEDLKEYFYLNSFYRFYDENFNLIKERNGFVTIKRKIFDNILRDKAENLGIKIIYNTFADYFERDNSRIRVYLKNKDSFIKEEFLDFDLIVISTGIDLNFAKKSGISLLPVSTYAFRTYIRIDKKIDFCSNYYPFKNSDSYFWTYPVEDNLINCGFAVFNEKNVDLKNNFEDYLKKYCMKFGFKILERGKLEFWPLKCGFKERKFSEERVILCGETIGTTFNKSGEGILPAIHNGLFAGKVIVNLNNDFSQKNLFELYDKNLLLAYKNFF